MPVPETRTILPHADSRPGILMRLDSDELEDTAARLRLYFISNINDYRCAYHFDKEIMIHRDDVPLPSCRMPGPRRSHQAPRHWPLSRNPYRDAKRLRLRGRYALIAVKGTHSASEVGMD